MIAVAMITAMVVMVAMDMGTRAIPLTTRVTAMTVVTTVVAPAILARYKQFKQKKSYP